MVEETSDSIHKNTEYKKENGNGDLILFEEDKDPQTYSENSYV